MNFVIFSYNFLPLNDAEAYCTTRFASALAYMGHSVDVITMQHPQKVSNDVYRQLVDERVRITRIPAKPKYKPLFSRIRYLTYEWESVDFYICINEVLKKLQNLDEPFLITRSNPLASSIVGWHCCKYAKKWIAHLSDPIPIPGREKGWRSIHGNLNRFWMRRVLQDADIISVTCPNAIRAFQEEYGKYACKTRFIVTPHIGEPPLQTKSVYKEETTDRKIHIVHKGVICAGRGAPELAKAVQRLNEDGYFLDFVQCGQVDDVGYVFENDPLVRRMDSCNVDIEYIPDLMVPLNYCPFISSKFVYRIFDDKPILLYTKIDSFSAELASKYPESGIFLADSTKNGSLVKALRTILELSEKSFNRNRIRTLFRRDTIINDFISNIK